MIGVGICWDQWYPEAARAMMLQGAEILLYPTAIGSEPYDLSLDTHARWQRAMQGHAVSNAVPVVAANRIGTEENNGASQSYYGHSFIADHVGELVERFGDKEEGVLVHSFDLGEIERYRAEWGFFRDRRTDLYAKSIV
jgi:N-carbamoylputrescine amidase